jgi:hypothetical protein
MDTPVSVSQDTLAKIANTLLTTAQMILAKMEEHVQAP